MVRSSIVSTVFVLAICLMILAAMDTARGIDQSAGFFSFINRSGDEQIEEFDEPEVKYCTCPYKVIAVGGSGSNIEHPFFGWMADNVDNVSANIPLEDENGDAVNNGDIKDKIDEEFDTDPKSKILIVAHSVGSARVNNILNSNEDEYGECVELISIDPPVEHNWCKGVRRFPAWLFNGEVRQICAARRDDLGSDENTIDWTEGTTHPDEAHDPFSFPDAEGSDDKLEELKDKIEEAKSACEDSVCPEQ